MTVAPAFAATPRADNHLCGTELRHRRKTPEAFGRAKLAGDLGRRGAHVQTMAAQYEGCRVIRPRSRRTRSSLPRRAAAARFI